MLGARRVAHAERVSVADDYPWGAFAAPRERLVEREVLEAVQDAGLALDVALEAAREPVTPDGSPNSSISTMNAVRDT